MSWPGLLLLMLAQVALPLLAETGNPAPGETMVPGGAHWPVPTCYPDPTDNTTACHNGILQVRPSRFGIIWFDFYHRGEDRWYIGKNNLNLMTLVPGEGWQNTELDRVVPTAQVILTSEAVVEVRYFFRFPNGARVHTDMRLQRGAPGVSFEVHQSPGSAAITGFQWHVTFGQAEAVQVLHFDDRRIGAADIPKPLPGGRERVQHHEFIRNIENPEFRFSGVATAQPDPANPRWMSRVLGLRQRVTWEGPMRPQDHFAYEVRDVPWQPGWGVPGQAPWIEGLWFIRNGPLPDGDRLTYTIDNLADFL
ncbi:MAG: hypothetical protein O2780_03970 [Proteobacteria bacterium]|nr:hypothetical protein [Pseudomonadota bacterium]MDA1300707.1 hypothetical protein [Pseudomonadota bacterium]